MTCSLEPGITRQAQQVGSTAREAAVELGRIENNIQIPSVPEGRGVESQGGVCPEDHGRGP
jgi:hypothetical protein